MKKTDQMTIDKSIVPPSSTSSESRLLYNAYKPIINEEGTGHQILDISLYSGDDHSESHEFKDELKTTCTTSNKNSSMLKLQNYIHEEEVSLKNIFNDFVEENTLGSMDTLKPITQSSKNPKYFQLPEQPVQHQVVADPQINLSDPLSKVFSVLSSDVNMNTQSEIQTFDLPKITSTTLNTPSSIRFPKKNSIILGTDTVIPVEFSSETMQSNCITSDHIKDQKQENFHEPGDSFKVNKNQSNLLLTQESANNPLDFLSIHNIQDKEVNSWDSDTESESLDRMAQVEEIMSQKIREYAKVSYLCRSTGPSTTSPHHNPSEVLSSMDEKKLTNNILPFTEVDLKQNQSDRNSESSTDSSSMMVINSEAKLKQLFLQSSNHSMPLNGNGCDVNISANGYCLNSRNKGNNSSLVQDPSSVLIKETAYSNNLKGMNWDSKSDIINSNKSINSSLIHEIQLQNNQGIRSSEYANDIQNSIDKLNSSNHKECQPLSNGNDALVDLDTTEETSTNDEVDNLSPITEEDDADEMMKDTYEIKKKKLMFNFISQAVTNGKCSEMVQNSVTENSDIKDATLSTTLEKHLSTMNGIPTLTDHFILLSLKDQKTNYSMKNDQTLDNLELNSMQRLIHELSDFLPNSLIQNNLRNNDVKMFRLNDEGNKNQSNILSEKQCEKFSSNFKASSPRVLSIRSPKASEKQFLHLQQSHLVGPYVVDNRRRTVCTSVIVEPDSKITTKAITLDTTVEDTDSISLNTNLEPGNQLIELTQTKSIERNEAPYSMKKISDNAAVSMINSMQHHECNEEKSEKFLNQCTSVLSQECAKIEQQPDSVSSIDVLRARLLQALQALQKEHTAYEELEAVRDACEARIREMNLQNINLLSHMCTDQKANDVISTNEIAMNVELRNQLDRLKFELIEKKEQSEYFERELKNINEYYCKLNDQLIKSENEKEDLMIQVNQLMHRLKYYNQKTLRDEPSVSKSTPKNEMQFALHLMTTSD
ncbi:unnamed protein product [Heterobilharzia americana]|nr:unnamed protein product [Heterobilharzia americana]